MMRRLANVIHVHKKAAEISDQSMNRYRSHRLYVKFHEHKELDVLYTGFMQAFDKVSHPKLIHNLWVWRKVD